VARDICHGATALPDQEIVEVETGHRLLQRLQGVVADDGLARRHIRTGGRQWRLMLIREAPRRLKSLGALFIQRPHQVEPCRE